MVEDVATTGVSVRPKSAEAVCEESVEEGSESEEDAMCEVCGVGEDEEDEEGSDGDDEEVSPFKKLARQAEGEEEEVNIFKAVKDERKN